MEEILKTLEMMMGVARHGIIQSQGEFDSEGKTYIWVFTLREKESEE